jgi:hypothetical protein
MTASMPAALGPFPFELFPAAICIDSTKTNPDPKEKYDLFVCYRQDCLDVPRGINLGHTIRKIQ